MNDCIFCKIIAGELPSWKVHEDERSLALLDLGPTNKGHTLVIPKKHFRDFLSIEAEYLTSALETIQKIARAVVAATGADGCNITTNNGAAAGQSVFHNHWHIIPRFDGDGLTPWPQGVYEEGEKEAFQEKIKNCL